MKRVVVRVYKVLQQMYIGVCVLVCEITPHFTLHVMPLFFIRFWKCLFRNFLPLSVWMYKGARSFIIALKASVTPFPC